MKNIHLNKSDYLYASLVDLPLFMFFIWFANVEICTDENKIMYTYKVSQGQTQIYT